MEKEISLELDLLFLEALENNPNLKRIYDLVKGGEDNVSKERVSKIGKADTSFTTDAKIKKNGKTA